MAQLAMGYFSWWYQTRLVQPSNNHSHTIATMFKSSVLFAALMALASELSICPLQKGSRYSHSYIVAAITVNSVLTLADPVYDVTETPELPANAMATLTGGLVELGKQTFTISVGYDQPGMRTTILRGPSFPTLFTYSQQILAVETGAVTTLPDPTGTNDFTLKAAKKTGMYTKTLTHKQDDHTVVVVYDAVETL